MRAKPEYLKMNKKSVIFCTLFSFVLFIASPNALAQGEMDFENIRFDNRAVDAETRQKHLLAVKKYLEIIQLGVSCEKSIMDLILEQLARGSEDTMNYDLFQTNPAEIDGQIDLGCNAEAERLLKAARSVDIYTVSRLNRMAEYLSKGYPNTYDSIGTDEAEVALLRKKGYEAIARFYLNKAKNDGADVLKKLSSMEHYLAKAESNYLAIGSSNQEIKILQIEWHKAAALAHLNEARSNPSLAVYTIDVEMEYDLDKANRVYHDCPYSGLEDCPYESVITYMDIGTNEEELRGLRVEDYRLDAERYLHKLKEGLNDNSYVLDDLNRMHVALVSANRESYNCSTNCPTEAKIGYQDIGSSEDEIAYLTKEAHKDRAKQTLGLMRNPEKKYEDWQYIEMEKHRILSGASYADIGTTKKEVRKLIGQWWIVSWWQDFWGWVLS